MRITRAVGVIVASVLSTTSVGTLTAMAATQTQSQGLYANQKQEVDTTGKVAKGTVSQRQTSVLTSKQAEKTGKQTPGQTVLNTNQSFIQSNQDHTVTGQTGYSQKQNDGVRSKMNKAVTTRSTLITTDANAKSKQQGTFDVTGTATVSQTTTTQMFGAQSQQAPGAWTMTNTVESSGSGSGSRSVSVSGSGSGPMSIFSSVSSSSSTLGNISSVTHITFGSQNNPIVSNVPVAGYAVFDLAGNRISDTFGGTSNATAQYDQFQPNQPVVLVLRPVDAHGNPVQNLNQATVYLKSSNSSSTMTVYGNTFSALLLKPGSYGVPFVYTNTGNAPGYDIIDPTNPPDRHHRPTVTMDSTQQGNVHLHQTEKVKAKKASTDSSVTASQTQTTGALSQQSQDNGSQMTGTSTSQHQETKTTGASSLSQTQNTKVTTHETQSSSTASGANGSLNINLKQKQKLHSTAGGTATESQSTTFGAQGSMQVSFSQTQKSSATSASQGEGIHVTASDPNGASSNGGTLSVSFNGKTTGQYTGITGNVTVSQSQTTGTGGSSNNQESNQISYQQGGKTVTVNVQ
ncbi:hypothetical protein LLE49_10155 [Alicyclobacillus tolerans]|uniref:hypothetical protein n=1 Tax=Alicyclobacillus tolerans TaxID=90970 RepID=UPI001F3559EE|nr:hypothetical protein [Alicyclobacillus tolerans]MCF8565076.1 hypothetical protein [Alicyclobacillus tolerans]